MHIPKLPPEQTHIIFTIELAIVFVNVAPACLHIVIKEFLKNALVITFAIAGSVYLLMNPSLSTLTAWQLKPSCSAHFDRPIRFVPFVCYILKAYFLISSV